MQHKAIQLWNERLFAKLGEYGLWLQVVKYIGSKKTRQASACRVFYVTLDNKMSVGNMIIIADKRSMRNMIRNVETIIALLTILIAALKKTSRYISEFFIVLRLIGWIGYVQLFFLFRHVLSPRH